LGIGLSGGTVIGLIFLYLAQLGYITVTGYSNDTVCAGTIEQPCYAYINFTTKQDIFIYPTNYDPYGRNSTFNFSPAIRDWRLQLKWGNGWRNILLNQSCTGTWCGLSNSKDTRLFSFAFRKGKVYQIRILGYKYNPSDSVKWGAFNTIDPVWEGIEQRTVTKHTFTPNTEIIEYADRLGNVATIYIGSNFVDSNGTLKAEYEQSGKSLKNCEFCDSIYILSINYDNKNHIVVNDYNLTNFDICVASNETGNIPLRVNTLNNSFDSKTQQQVTQKITKSEITVPITKSVILDSKDKEDLISNKNASKLLTPDWNCYNLTINIFTDEIEWGLNSTSIQLKNGNLTDDIYYTNHSFCTVMCSSGGQIKFNISILNNPGITIINATLGLYTNDSSYFSGDTDIRLWRINDQTWTESSSAATINGQTKTNETNRTFSLTQSTWSAIDVTNITKTDQILGNNYVTIRFEDQDYLVINSILDVTNVAYLLFSAGYLLDYLLFASSENPVTGTQPYLNITYSEPPDYSPTYSSNGTNTTTYNNGNTVLMFVNFSDDIGLNYTWCHNNFTGSWINETKIARNGVLNYNHTNITQITAGTGKYMCWQCFANDSIGQLNQTSQYCFTTVNNYSITWFYPTTANPLSVSNLSNFSIYMNVTEDGVSLTSGVSYLNSTIDNVNNLSIQTYSICEGTLACTNYNANQSQCSNCSLCTWNGSIDGNLADLTAPADWATWEARGAGWTNISSAVSCSNDDNDQCMQFNRTSQGTNVITKQSSVDMSNCTPGSLWLYIGQVAEVGTLALTNDCIYVDFSANGGTSWSNKTTIFCDDSPAATKNISIWNSSYYVSTFRYRFNGTGFNVSTRAASLDNISVNCTPKKCNNRNGATCGQCGSTNCSNCTSGNCTFNTYNEFGLNTSNSVWQLNVTVNLSASNLTGLQDTTVCVNYSNVVFCDTEPDNLDFGGDEAPQYSTNSTNTTGTAGEAVQHRLYWTDETGLSGYIFSIRNGTSTWVNDSWVSMIGTTNWSNVTKIINSSTSTIYWQIFTNDTSDNWNASGQYYYSVTAGAPPSVCWSYSNKLLSVPIGCLYNVSIGNQEII